MSLKKIFSSISVAVFIAVNSISAQEKFSLNDLATLTLQENYQLQIIKNQQKSAENLNTAGNAGMLPSVAISSENSFDIQTSESRLYTGATRSGTNASSTRLGVAAEANWTVFDGFTMFARRDRLSLLASMSASDTRFYIEQTLSDLSKSYNLLIREFLILDLYRKLIEVSEYRLNLEDRKLKLGAGNALMYNQALIDYNADSSLLLQQAYKIREQQIRINTIINRNPEAAPEPDSIVIILDGLRPSERLIEMAMRYSPELERSQFEEMLAETETKMEKGLRYPEVSLFSNIYLNYQSSETGIVESAHSRGGQIGLRVRFNLYDGGRQNSRISNALLSQNSAILQRSEAVKRLEAELLRLVSLYENLADQHRILLTSTDAVEKSLAIAFEQLQAGAINGYEFRLTQLNALHVRQQLIDIKLAMKTIETDVYRICGELTEKMMNTK